MAKNFFEELAAYRVKVERDGKAIMNVPGILALPGLLLAPKLGIAGMIAAPLLGCSIHLENEDGKNVDLGKAMKDAAGTVADTTASAVRTVREKIDKVWDELSADDPEGCPEGEENEDEPAVRDGEGDGVPTVTAHPEDPEKES